MTRTSHNSTTNNNIWSSFTKKAIKFAAIAALGFTLTACKEDLYTKMTESEANEMLSVLLRNNVNATRTVAKDGSNVLKVETAQRSEAIELLKSKGYPKQVFSNLCDTFKSNGFVASPTEERARLACANNDEASKSVMKIQGVTFARVLTVMPKNDPFKLERAEGSASVVVQHDAATDMTPLKAHIKMTVANSIEGLSYDKVSVVFTPVESNRDDLAASRNAATERNLEFYAYILAGIMAVFGLGILLSSQISKLFSSLTAGKNANAFPTASSGNLGAAE
jgi:type III secretion protein J